jgi:hypothetical protein
LMVSRAISEAVMGPLAAIMITTVLVENTDYYAVKK